MVHFPSGKNLEKEYFLDIGSDNENSDEPLSSQQYWTAETLVYRIENWDLHVARERLSENSKDRKLTSITPEIYTYICAKLYDTSVHLFASAMPCSLTFMAVLLDNKRDNTQDDKQLPESLILPT